MNGPAIRAGWPPLKPGPANSMAYVKLSDLADNFAATAEINANEAAIAPTFARS